MFCLYIHNPIKKYYAQLVPFSQSFFFFAEEDRFVPGARGGVTSRGVSVTANAKQTTSPGTATARPALNDVTAKAITTKKKGAPAAAGW